jgi:hypothetical protein
MNEDEVRRRLWGDEKRRGEQDQQQSFERLRVNIEDHE